MDTNRRPLALDVLRKVERAFHAPAMVSAAAAISAIRGLNEGKR
jgi:hypothetical protein